MKQLIVLVFLFLASCKSEMVKIPNEDLAPETMVQILADIHFADAIAEHKASAGMSERMLNETYYDQIFSKRKVDKAVFYRSYKFYEQHPEWLNKVYDDVLTEMSKREENASKH